MAEALFHMYSLVHCLPYPQAPPRNQEKGLVTLAKFQYVLCHQPSFGVEEQHLSIIDYYILDT